MVGSTGACADEVAPLEDAGATGVEEELELLDEGRFAAGSSSVL